MFGKLLSLLPRGDQRMSTRMTHAVRSPGMFVGPSTVKAVAFAFFFGLALLDPALAGGFDKVEENATNFQDMLKTLAIIIVTIAIMFAGFKIIFQGARFGDVAGVLIGGSLIGGATGLAGWISTPD